ncbi:hypothetical protein EG68_12264, partial [Paragonimus skrjabini miyazakii]
WPPGISPFTGAVALQKESAKDALSPIDLKRIMDAFNGPDHDAYRYRPVPGDILIDDRKGLSLGRKLIDLKRLGIPWIVIAKVRFLFSLITSLVVAAQIIPNGRCAVVLIKKPAHKYQVVERAFFSAHVRGM